MIEDNVADILLHSTHGAVIYCFGDEQRGSQGFGEYRSRSDKAIGPGQDCFDEMVHQFKKEPGSKYALHMGDAWDFIRPTMRARIEAPLVHDGSAKAQVDDMVRRAQDADLKQYTPFEGRFIGLHEGHHSWKFSEGVSTDQRLAAAMRGRFLGWIGATRLRVRLAGKKDDFAYVKTMLSTHGQGGSRTAGSDAKYIDELAKGFISDIYVRGHSCKSLVHPAMSRRTIRRVGEPGIESVTPWYINTPGMCEGYTDGWNSSYAERAGYIPQSLGWCVIRLKMVQRKEHAQAKGLKAQRNGSGRVTYSNAVDIQASPVIFNG